MQQRINLNLRVTQKQVLTPGLVQMVSVLALNKLELRDMINTEMVENPVLEEVADGEIETDAETLSTIEQQVAAESRIDHAADREITQVQAETAAAEAEYDGFDTAIPRSAENQGAAESLDFAADAAPVKEKDAFEEIDFGSFFDDYL